MAGRKFRIGLLVPSSNTTLEVEFWRSVPAGVSVHSSRLEIRETTLAGLTAMDKELDHSVDLLATAGVDLICYGCTTGSLREGIEQESVLQRRIEERAGVPTVTTASAVVNELRRLEVRRLAVATPYIEELNVKEQEYLESAGFQVVGIEGLGIRENLDIGRCLPEQAASLGRAVMAAHPEAEALFISCTNFPTMQILGPLSNELRKPVVSSNEATILSALAWGGFSRDPLRLVARFESNQKGVRA